MGVIKIFDLYECQVRINPSGSDSNFFTHMDMSSENQLQVGVILVLIQMGIDSSIDSSESQMKLGKSQI